MSMGCFMTVTKVKPDNARTCIYKKTRSSKSDPSLYFLKL